MRGRTRILVVAVFVALQSPGRTTCAVSFGQGTRYPVGAGPFGMATGDFNGDGKLDIAVANSGSGSISVLLGNGDGTFQMALNTPAGQTPWALIAKDLNGDGLLDLAVADEAGSAVVLLGKGDGPFKRRLQLPSMHLRAQLPWLISITTASRTLPLASST